MGEQARNHTRLARRTAWWALLLGLTLVTVLAVGSLPVLAQPQAQPVGTVLRVANTDGDRLNLRAGPSTTQTIVAGIEPGAMLTVTGAAQTAGGIRWLPVRTATGQTGWVSDQFVTVVTTPVPLPAPTRAPAPTSTPSGPAAQPAGIEAPLIPAGGPLEIEAKLKFPEMDGREQEITVWVTRDGLPVPGVIVTLETVDGDDAEDDERFRSLDPTNEEGRTRSTFDVRNEKGTVELKILAVAPDGSAGQSTVSYFRR